MPEFTVYKEHRIFCGRCHHWGNINELGEPEFDRNGLKGYWCGDCGAKFGACTQCGKFSPSGNHCSYCFPAGVDQKEISANPLPAGLDKADFTRYNSSVGVFIHVPTGTVYALPADFLDGYHAEKEH